MEIIEIVLCLIIVTIGFLAGCFTARRLCVPKHAGVLQLYKDDSGEGTSMFVELEESADNLRTAKYVIFKVNNIR